MKKVLCLFLASTLLFISSYGGLAYANVSEDQALTKESEDLLKDPSALRDLAIQQNKVLDPKVYQKMVEKLHADNDITSFQESLKKYEIDLGSVYEDNSGLRTAVGSKRIRTTAYYLYEIATDKNFTVSDTTKINTLSFIVTFTGFIPGYVSVGSSMFSILSLIISSNNAPQDQGYHSLSVRPKYDQVIYSKYAEMYMDDSNWEAKAMTQKRNSDGYYVISGYKNGSHFSRTKNYGRIRTDTGKYYNNEQGLLNLIQYGAQPFIKYDYLSGTTTYN